MTGFVYAIGDSNRVKIGWSRDPMRRLAAIRTGCPIDAQLLGLVPATRAQEIEAHGLLAPWRIQGEWFRRKGAVAAFVAMLPRPKPKPVEIPKDASPQLRWRLERGLTLREAASVLNVKATTVFRWETGKRKVAVAMLPIVSARTGIAKADLRPDLAALIEWKPAS